MNLRTVRDGANAPFILSYRFSRRLGKSPLPDPNEDEFSHHENKGQAYIVAAAALKSNWSLLLITLAPSGSKI